MTRYAKIQIQNLQNKSANLFHLRNKKLAISGCSSKYLRSREFDIYSMAVISFG